MHPYRLRLKSDVNSGASQSRGPLRGTITFAASSGSSAPPVMSGEKTSTSLSAKYFDEEAILRLPHEPALWSERLFRCVTPGSPPITLTRFPPSPLLPSMVEYVYARHDFSPEHEDEIPFRAGDRIEIVEKDDDYGDGWWKVCFARSGPFPCHTPLLYTLRGGHLSCSEASMKSPPCDAFSPLLAVLLFISASNTPT